MVCRNLSYILCFINIFTIFIYLLFINIFTEQARYGKVRYTYIIS